MRFINRGFLFLSDRSPKDILLVVCIFLSYFATFTGVFDLLNQSGEWAFWEIIIAVIFSFLIQFGVYYFAKQWWATRIRHYLPALCLFVFISIVFAWGFYFNRLGLDVAIAKQTYADERSNMLKEVRYNEALIDSLTKKIDKLVEHSNNMVAKEREGGNTCDVALRGYGPRAAFRKKDADTFSHHQGVFSDTSSEFNRIHQAMRMDNFREFSVSNVETLNGYVQELNVVIDDFANEKKIYINWLTKRNRHNTLGFYEPFGNGIHRDYIRCPDDIIADHQTYLEAMEPFEELSSVHIVNPNTSGVQVSQAFGFLLDLMKGNFVVQELLALLLALLVDLTIILLTYKRSKSVPPVSFPSWPEYFSVSEYKELMRLLVISKGKKGYFYIPINREDLIASMLPLISENMAVFKEVVPWWQESFRVPKYIRERGNGCGFNRYQMNVHCLSAWILDFKQKGREDRKQNVELQHNDEQRPIAHNGSFYMGKHSSIPDLEIDLSRMAPSSNGNGSMGVRRDV